MGFQSSAAAILTYEGAPAYERPPREELYLLVANQLFSGDSFYERQSDTLLRFRRLVNLVASEPEGGKFIAALAVYTRTQLMLRTTPTMLVCEAFFLGVPEAAEAARRVWIRGDEHLEALAYVQAVGQKAPKALLRAIAARLNALTERQAIRYAATGKGKQYSQRDALRITHARPTDEKQSALFRSLTQGWKALTEEERALLPQNQAVREDSRTVSWEQLLSKEGSTPEVWAKASKQMGYMALLRNLRNLVTMEVGEETLREVAVRLSDPVEVERSMQLPYRFYSAYNALGKPTPVNRRVRVARIVEIIRWQRKRMTLPSRGLNSVEVALRVFGAVVPEPQPRTVSVRVRQSNRRYVGSHWENQRTVPWGYGFDQGAGRDVPEYLWQAIETAMECSAQRLKPLGGRTAVFVDLSGSMHDPVSAKSIVTRMEAACTLAGLIGRQMQGDVYAFGTTFRRVNVQDAPSALKAAQRIEGMQDQVGGGTYLLPAFEAAFHNDYDRVIVLTDEQVADQAWVELKQYLNDQPDRTAYVLNLAGYSPSMTAKHDRLVTVGGFSDRVLDWLGALELAAPVEIVLRSWDKG